MTKELSKQLCELCGVPPEKYEDYELNEYKVYPDFGNPNNFVKLLELQSPSYQDWSLIDEVLRYFNFENKINFLKCVIETLQTEGLEDTENFKQAIKNTQWEY